MPFAQNWAKAGSDDTKNALGPREPISPHEPPSPRTHPANRAPRRIHFTARNPLPANRAPRI
eukprot:12600930-Prorocentrum_lima.AAC.1